MRGSIANFWLVQGCDIGWRLCPADHGHPNLVALYGIESPGLTASLAIGDAVADAIGVSTGV